MRPTEPNVQSDRVRRMAVSYLRHLSLKQKLIAVIMLTCLGSLLLASGVFVVWEWTTLHRGMIRDLKTHAEILANNCKTAVAFRDPSDAGEILRSVERIPSMVSACIYTTDGEPLATYMREGKTLVIPPLAELEDGPKFEDSRLILTYPILLEEERIGSICLRADIEAMHVRLQRSVIAIGAILALSSLAAYLVSSKLQRIISSPILHLASVANYVSERRQYTVRAESYGDDEVGWLIQAFNEMLDQIQQRDGALVEANEQLEARVRKRMAEVTAANASLTREITFRKRAEQILVHRAERIVNHQRALLRLAKDTGNELPLVLKKTAEETGKTLGVERISIWFLREPSCELICQHIHTLGEGTRNEALSLKLTDHSAYLEAIESNRILAVTNVQVDPRTGGFSQEYFGPLGITSTIDVPIRLHARLLGVVRCEHVGSPREWSLEEQDFAASVADMIALQVETNERRKLERALARANEHLAETVRDLRRSNKDLQDFAYVTAHDLKAPLRGIGTLADWLVADHADKLDAEGREQLRLLKGRVARMSGLIDGILHYSEIGRVAGRLDYVNLSTLVPDVVACLEPPANIQVVIAEALPTIVGVSGRLRQVFHNLIDNAIKYLDKPQGRIEITCTEEESLWRFAISDNGPGIDEKYFEKIFQVFQTLVPRDERESTGIGLAIVKKIVEFAGGDIWVESEVGVGTTMVFTLAKKTLRIQQQTPSHETVIHERREL